MTRDLSRLHSDRLRIALQKISQASHRFPTNVGSLGRNIAEVAWAAVRLAKEGNMYAAEMTRRLWRGRRETVVLEIGIPMTAKDKP